MQKPPFFFPLSGLWLPLSLYTVLSMYILWYASSSSRYLIQRRPCRRLILDVHGIVQNYN